MVERSIGPATNCGKEELPNALRELGGTVLYERLIGHPAHPDRRGLLRVRFGGIPTRGSTTRIDGLEPEAASP